MGSCPPDNGSTATASAPIAAIDDSHCGKRRTKPVQRATVPAERGFSVRRRPDDMNLVTGLAEGRDELLDVNVLTVL